TAAVRPAVADAAAHVQRSFLASRRPGGTRLVRQRPGALLGRRPLGRTPSRAGLSAARASSISARVRFAVGDSAIIRTTGSVPEARTATHSPPRATRTPTP